MITNEEYIEKCMSVTSVLAKITKGIRVSPAERLKACQDAIEVFYYDNLQNGLKEKDSLRKMK